MEAIKTVEGLVPNFISYPLQRNAIREMRQRGGNALGIDQDEPLFSKSHQDQRIQHLLTWAKSSLSRLPGRASKAMQVSLP